MDRIALAVLTAIALGHAPQVVAQQYKWLGADGRVNYSDMAPAGNIDLLSRPKGSPEDARTQAALPYALRAAGEKYPVTLYTTRECAPCKAARDHLIQRGVPFSEMQLTTHDDAAAFKKLGFDGSSMPGLSVGRQNLTGYEMGSYDNLLDAAGYPKSSILPTQYSRPAARPLTEPKPVAEGAPQTLEAPARTAEVRPPALPSVPRPQSGDPNFRF